MKHISYQVAALLRAVAEEVDRRVRWGAFAMGQHQRLGALSLVQGLDADVAHMILKFGASYDSSEVRRPEDWVDGSAVLRMVKVVAAVVTVVVAVDWSTRHWMLKVLVAVVTVLIAVDESWVDGGWVPWMVTGVAGVVTLAISVLMVLGYQ